MEKDTRISSIKFEAKEKGLKGQHINFLMSYDPAYAKLRLLIQTTSGTTEWEIYLPCLSVGHEFFNSDQIHLVYSEIWNQRNDFIFVVECGLNIPEFRIAESINSALNEMTFFIDHDTQDHINSFLEKLPIGKKVIKNSIYPINLIDSKNTERIF